MEHFYVITNKKKDPDYQVTYQIRDYLEKCGKKCSIQDDDDPVTTGKYTDAGDVEKDVDCVIVLGGDGTLLQAASDLADKNVPFLGINLGTLGFLAEVNKDDFEDALKKILAGEYDIEKRLMLEGCSIRDGGQIDNTRALNDIIITFKGSLRIVNFSISVNGQFLHRYHADGLIVATAVGSTAYSLSAGGAILPPDLDAMIITPICPHTLKARCTVVPGNDEIWISPANPYRSEVSLLIDGEPRGVLENDEFIKVTKSKYRTRLIKPNNKNFFDVLRQKLAD